MRRSTIRLAGLLLAAASGAAMATTPDYDYLELDYVHLDESKSDINSNGVQLALSALIAPYVFLDLTYQWTETDEFQRGTPQGRVQNQFITLGAGGRFPLVLNTLDATVGADVVYADFKNKGEFEGIYEDDDDVGYQVKASLRANFRWVEVIPTFRYVDVFDNDDFVFGVQLLGCPGYGICLTGGYERFKDAEENRFFGGVRFYYN